jgi:hypothetical protein
MKVRRPNPELRITPGFARRPPHVTHLTLAYLLGSKKNPKTLEPNAFSSLLPQASVDLKAGRPAIHGQVCVSSALERPASADLSARNTRKTRKTNNGGFYEHKNEHIDNEDPNPCISAP